MWQRVFRREQATFMFWGLVGRKWQNELNADNFEENETEVKQA